MNNKLDSELLVAETELETGIESSDVKESSHKENLLEATAAVLDEETVDEPKHHWGWTIVGLVILFGLAWTTQYLVAWIPKATKGTSFGNVAKSIEFPIYAIILGFGVNAILSSLKIREKMSAAFRTEFFIKTGVVLLGASVNFMVIVRSAGPAVLQAVLMIVAVFFFTWWLGGVFKLDDRLRAIMSSSVSICGVSAAIAAGGAVKARKEQLAYIASLVIVFAVPAIFFMPWLAGVLGLSPEVTGAWIGGNIDTTAAVTAAGTLAGETSLQIATIVKVSQNAMMGIVAIVLTIVFAFRERTVDAEGKNVKVPFGELWNRFPKFVLGFLLASIAATLLSTSMPEASYKAGISAANALRTWAFVLAFISIGLEFKVTSLKEAGWKPVVVFGSAVVFNMVFGLGLSWILFHGFTV